MAAQAQTASSNVTAVPEKRLENSALRTASDTIHAITESTKQVFEASERLAQDLEELGSRICEGADFRAQIAKRPWLIAALTVAGGAVIWNAFNRRRRMSPSH
jgi:metal-dependent amidase/aminoacylase/carboxypeptidase family protein